MPCAARRSTGRLALCPATPPPARHPHAGRTHTAALCQQRRVARADVQQVHRQYRTFLSFDDGCTLDGVTVVVELPRGATGDTIIPIMPPASLPLPP